MSLSVFWHYVRLRLKERLEYRGAFLIGMGAQMLAYCATYLVTWMLLQRFETISGWGWPEVAFLYSLNLLTYALGAAFTFSQMTALEQMVTRGTFDGVLIRPLNPYLALAAQMFNVGYLGHVILSAGVLFWAATQLDIAWSARNVIFLSLSIASGMFIQAGLLTLLGAWAFLFIRSSFLFSLYGALRGFISYPISVYGTLIQLLLTAVLPLAFVNFYPSTILLSREGQMLPGWVGWLTPLIGPLFFWLSYELWMRGVNRYQGAGG